MKSISYVRLEGWQVETEVGLSVAVDTELSEELQKEGLAREFVNRVQNMRKEANFSVTDRIVTGVQANENLASAIKLYDRIYSTRNLIREPRARRIKGFRLFKIMGNRR